ncbi:MAG: hypothetical protein AAAFM81_12485 [Pseudomonadota bacterium]
MDARRKDRYVALLSSSIKADVLHGGAVDLQKDWAELYPGKTLPGNQDDFIQLVRHCTSDGEFVWGGISFYAAEGLWGIGGLARENIATGDMDVIRPRGALELSTGPVAHVAGELWFGQYHYGECEGPTSGTGLKKLRFNEVAQRYESESVPEVCGFAIRDFQELDGALWVATDLGVSRLTPGEPSQWTNFVPDLRNNALVMREVSCDTLYAELLSSEQFANTEGFDLGFAFEDLWNRLREHRPEFVRRHLRKLHSLEAPQRR